MKAFLDNSPVAAPTPEQQSAAKIVGFMYVVTMATAVFGEIFVKSKFIVAGDAAATAANIVASEQFFRLGILADLLTVIGVITLIWALYVVLQPVSRHLALLAAFFRLIEIGVIAGCFVHVLLVLRILTGTAAYFQEFEPAQLQVLARLHLNGQAFGTQISFIVFGFGSAIFAYLWLKSGYIPKALSWLGILASSVMSAVGLVSIVFPDLSNTLGLAYMMPMGVFEVGLGIWLLLKGLRTPILIQN